VILLGLLGLTLSAISAQESSVPDLAQAQVPACESCQGKRIAHTSGTILFCVPRGVKVDRDSGFEGDIHDLITLSRCGELGKLIVSSSPNSSGYPKFAPPDWFPAEAAGHSSVRNWRCSEGDGRDLRLARNGRNWRMITFPLGYAEYSNVSDSIAARFDRVLDSLCCRPLQSSPR